MRRGLSLPNPTPTGEFDGPIPFCPHRPHPGKQAAFLALDCREAFYGGAAGGGKSDALLMAALQWVDTPAYAALLLRRTYADLSLPGALMDRAAEWFQPTTARWHETEKTWEFPSGATITFGYLQTERDKYRYKSSEFQFIGFDELTSFTESMYRYLFSRLRRLQGSEIPLRMRSGSNPGDIGHEWVKSRFQIPKERLDTLHETPEGRVFVPARLEDNPSLDRAEYIASLAELDPITRQQLLAGDWEISPEGKLFRRQWFPLLEEAPREERAVRFWDFAATKPKDNSDPDWTCGVRVAETPGGFVVTNVLRVRETPRQVELLVRQTAAVDGRQTQIAVEQEPGSAGVAVVERYITEVLKGFAVRGYRNTGSKLERARPVSSQAEAGNLSLLSAAWNGPFLDELAAFPTEGVHDDQVDALSGAMAMLCETEENPLAGLSVVGRVRGWGY